MVLVSTEIMNNWKGKYARAGISTRCYTVYDEEMVEQYKTTAAYRRWKKEYMEYKNGKNKKFKNKNKACLSSHGSYIPAHARFHYNKYKRK